jgi:hemolysin activation/secretion protein
MNKFLVRLSLAAAMTMGVMALGSSANAQDQQSSQEPAATTPPQQQQPTATPPDQAPAAAAEQPQQPNESQSNETQSNDMKGQDAKSFTGQVAIEKGKIVLKDPVTKMSYQLDDQAKAANYVGKQVKVTGKLDMNSNTIQVESIEPIS